MGKCKKCGKPMGGFLSFGKPRESEAKGVCEKCFAEKEEKKELSKAEKRKQAKLRKAWLHKR